MICTCCGAYFKQTAFNQSTECDGCQDDFEEVSELCPDEAVYEADMIELKNPSGKTLPVFYE